MTKNIPWQRIVDISLNAPSGGNLQPWSITKDNDSLIIHTHLPKSEYIQSYDKIGAYVSIGASAFNIETVAKGFGYSSHTSIMEKETPYIKITLLDFNEANSSQSAIDNVINRTTNRKPTLQKLPPHIIEHLATYFQQYLNDSGGSSFKLKFTRDVVLVE